MPCDSDEAIAELEQSALKLRAFVARCSEEPTFVQEHQAKLRILASGLDELVERIMEEIDDDRPSR